MLITLAQSPLMLSPPKPLQVILPLATALIYQVANDALGNRGKNPPKQLLCGMSIKYSI